MQHHTHNGTAPSHGFKVGIGTMAVTALYEFLLKQPLADLNLQTCAERWPDKADLPRIVSGVFPEGDDLIQLALEESCSKWLSRNALLEQLQTLKKIWPELRSKLVKQLIPLTELKRMLINAGAPVEPEQIGIPRTRLRRSFDQAYHIRQRFTVLDVAMRCGLLEKALDDIFGVAGPWPVISQQ